MKLPAPYLDFQLLLDSQVSKLSATATIGNSHIQIPRRLGSNREKVREQERPVRPLPDGPVGAWTCRPWSWVTRSDHCAVTVKRETGHLTSYLPETSEESFLTMEPLLVRRNLSLEAGNETGRGSGLKGVLGALASLASSQLGWHC